MADTVPDGTLGAADGATKEKVNHTGDYFLSVAAVLLLEL